MDFEFKDNIPIYIQIVEQLKMHIISGKVKKGERIPSVREFAKLIDVNPNTVQKALVELEELKLIYTERTNGKYVTDDQELIDKLRIRYANELSNKFFNSMKEIGFKKMETIKHLKKIGECK